MAREFYQGSQLVIYVKIGDDVIIEKKTLKNNKV